MCHWQHLLPSDDLSWYVTLTSSFNATLPWGQEHVPYSTRVHGVEEGEGSSRSWADGVTPGQRLTWGACWMVRSPPWYHQPLLPSAVLLLSLLLLASHLLFFETPRFNFFRTLYLSSTGLYFQKGWLCSCHRNSRSAEQSKYVRPSPCRETLRAGHTFLVIPRESAKNWLIRRDPDAGKDWGQEEKGTTEDEMAGWHHQLSGHEFE